MPTEKIAVRIDGDKTEELSLAYEVIGDAGRTWALTPGGRFSKEYPGVRELAMALAELGNRVLIYDRPNTGDSDVCIAGSTESGMQADALAALLSHLNMAPAVIIGGSGGARVSLLTAARHPSVTSGLAVWMISGGPFGLMVAGTGYCAERNRGGWTGGLGGRGGMPQPEQGKLREGMDRKPPNPN